MRDVVVVVPWLEGGGAQRALEGLLRPMNPRRVHIIVLFAGSKNYDSLKSVGYKITLLEEPRSAFGSFRASRKVRPFLKGDGRVFSLMRASHVVIGMSGRCRLLRGRFIGSIHQMPWLDSVGLTGKIEDFFQRRALRHAVFVTSPSAAALDYLVAKEDIAAEQAVIEDNILFLDSDGAFPAEFRQAEPLRLLFCGRLEYEKGLDELISVMARCRRPIDLVIAGGGSAESELRDLASRLKGGPHTIRFEGYRDDVLELIDRAHLAIMPSRSELQPVFVWECWARGRGVVASAIRAFLDLSEKGPIHVFQGAEDLASILESADSVSEPYSSDFQNGLNASNRLAGYSSVQHFLAGRTGKVGDL